MLSVGNSTTAQGSNSLDVAVPTGVTDGDVIVIMMNSEGGSSWSIPGGFTDASLGTIQSGSIGGICWKIASGESGSYHLAVNQAGVNVSAICVDIKGAKTTGGSPFKATNSHVQNANANNVISGGITTTVANSLVLFTVGDLPSRTLNSVAVANNNPTWNSVNQVSNGNERCSMFWATYVPQQSTGNGTVNFSGSANSGAALIQFEPAPVPASGFFFAAAQQ